MESTVARAPGASPRFAHATTSGRMAIRIHRVIQTASSASQKIPARAKSSVAIDVQKINWKFRIGLHEQTGVSLQERLPHNARGGDTREHQDTAQSRNRQRPLQPSAVRLSAR